MPSRTAAASSSNSSRPTVGSSATFRSRAGWAIRPTAANWATPRGWIWGNPTSRATKINWAHLALAQLIDGGYIDRVLTTNFDPLVSRACALVNSFPAVYDFAASRVFNPDQISEKAIFHL